MVSNLIDLKHIAPFIVALVLFGGCGKRAEESKAQPQKPQQEMRTSDPAAFVTATFHVEQQTKRDALRKQIDSLTAQSVIDRKQITMLINKRKGELMSLKKFIRNSTMYNAAQRDSLVAPLDDESFELAGDLVAVSK